MKLAPFATRSPFILAFSFCAAAGCAADIDIEKPEDAVTIQDVRVGASTLELGRITYGNTRTVSYTSTPTLRSFRFRAAAGDRADVWVRSARGDAMLWLTDASRNIVAQNDDNAPGSLDAHVATTLRTAGEYIIFFRDYHRQSQTFTVSLAGGPDMTSCGGDRDCVAVSAGGCCNSWQRVAINTAYVDAYAAANTCNPPYPPCAQPNDEIVAEAQSRVAVCNLARRQCELLAPTEIACGRFATNPHECPTGYACQAATSPTSAPGRCVRGCVGPDGTTYSPGQSFANSCNTCSCTESGRIVCTSRACPAVCTHMGRTYPLNTTFNDGCNDCRCGSDAQVVCTRRACVCNPAREPNRRYVGTPATCPLIRFACMPGEQMFSNTCGCGCER
jgi:hypothetical protein